MRKSIFLFLILALFCGCLSYNSQEMQSNFNHNKLSINSFWVYYGSNHVEELSKYDLVIIEPYNYNKEDIKRLKELNPKIKVIAYLSIGEVDKERDYFEDCKSIIIGKNPNWDSYYVNISSQIWKNIIFNEIDKFIDDAVINNIQIIRIVHGKGTGALRSKVRQYLRKNRKVDSFRSAETNVGGDGVTVVNLKI